MLFCSTSQFPQFRDFPIGVQPLSAPGDLWPRSWSVSTPVLVLLVVLRRPRQMDAASAVKVFLEGSVPLAARVSRIAFFHILSFAFVRRVK